MATEFPADEVSGLLVREERLKRNLENARSECVEKEVQDVDAGREVMFRQVILVSYRVVLAHVQGGKQLIPGSGDYLIFYEITVDPTRIR